MQENRGFRAQIIVMRASTLGLVDTRVLRKRFVEPDPLENAENQRFSAGFDAGWSLRTADRFRGGSGVGNRVGGVKTACAMRKAQGKRNGAAPGMASWAIRSVAVAGGLTPIRRGFGRGSMGHYIPS